MAANKEAVLSRITKMIKRIYTAESSFFNSELTMPIESVPDEYKILYQDIAIDIDKIGDLLAYYHYQINLSFRSVNKLKRDIFSAYFFGQLSSYAREILLLVELLNLIGYPIRLIRYQDEIKRAKKIKLNKICEYEPIFDMSEDSQIASIENVKKITEQSAREEIRKSKKRISEGDYSGAITNSRSLVEGVIKDIYEKITGEDIKSKGDLGADWKKLSKKLNLHPEKHPSDDLKKITSGLFSIINGLSAVRNKLSDSHGNPYKPEKHHAEFAVHTAFVITHFLYNTYNYQVQQSENNPAQ